TGSGVLTQRTAIVAGLIALGLCGAGAAQAQPYYYGYGPSYYDQALPPYEIMRVVRSTGLLPLSRPMRRGPTYVVVATNRSGGQMRVVVDAFRGDILNVNPLVAMPDEPPRAFRPDHRFDGGVPPVPPRNIPSVRTLPPPGMGSAPPTSTAGPPVSPHDLPNERVANAPPMATPAAPAAQAPTPPAPPPPPP